MGGVDWDAQCPHCKQDINYNCMGNENNYEKIEAYCKKCNIVWIGKVLNNIKKDNKIHYN